MFADEHQRVVARQEPADGLGHAGLFRNRRASQRFQGKCQIEIRAVVGDHQDLGGDDALIAEELAQDFSDEGWQVFFGRGSGFQQLRFGGPFTGCDGHHTMDESARFTEAPNHSEVHHEIRVIFLRIHDKTDPARRKPFENSLGGFFGDFVRAGFHHQIRPIVGTILRIGG